MADAGRAAAAAASRRVSGRPSFNDSQIVPSLLELSSWKREAVNQESSARRSGLLSSY